MYKFRCRVSVITVIAVVQLLLSICAMANIAPEQVAIQKNLQETFEENRKCIVKVYAQKKLFIKDEKGNKIENPTLDVGSGFLISKDGIVATSAYITHNAEKLWIEWCGKLFNATLKGFDPLTTLSIAKIEGDFKKLNAPFVNLDSSDNLPAISTMLLGISNELGLPPSPRLGLVSGHNIEFGGALLPTVYLRTTIKAPRGSAGGAVFDLSGKFIGMLIASIPEADASFILPAKAATKIKDDILLCGEPVYSWFGLQAEDTEGENGTMVVVKLVAENAPAKKAGFKKGDIILEINSQKVVNNTQLRNVTFFVRPKETAVFKIKRASEIIKLEVLAERMTPDFVHAAESNLSPKSVKEEEKR